MDFLRNWTVEPTAVGLLVTSLFIYYLHVRICIYRTRLKCRFFELSFHPCRRRCHLQGTFSPFRSVVWRLWRGRETFWGAKKGHPLSRFTEKTAPIYAHTSILVIILVVIAEYLSWVSFPSFNVLYPLHHSLVVMLLACGDERR